LFVVRLSVRYSSARAASYLRGFAIPAEPRTGVALSWHPQGPSL